MSNELSRRLFLKLLGLTSAAAAGCAEPPTRQLMPYIIPDENVIPGVPSFYASVCRECPAGCGVVARVREGRVIKLEGNPHDPISNGALCARGQAALQGLYHPDRLATPQQREDDGTLTSISWEAALQSFGQRLQAVTATGAHRVAFLGPALGPTLDRVVERWLQAWGSSRRLCYEALDEESARTAAELCFHRSDLPIYRLDAAQVILSFGADFLETWRSPVEFTRQYAAFRTPRPGHDGTTIGRAVYIGPRFGLTAANCDEWVAPLPGTEALVALGVLYVIVHDGYVKTHVNLDRLKGFTNDYEPTMVAKQVGVPAAKIRQLAEWFGQAEGALAVAGTDDSTTHVAISLLNAVTGNLGKTVQFLTGAPAAVGSRPQEVIALLNAMRAGIVDVLVVTGANPAFTLPAFREAVQHVPMIVWIGGVPDETAEVAHLLLPCHHTLESWGDVAPRPDVFILGQPVMQPVFHTLPLGDMLLASVHAAGASTETLPWENMQAAVEATWREFHATLGDGTTFATFWQQAREAGGVFQDARVATVNLRPEVLDLPIELPHRSPTDLTLVAFPHLLLYDGRGADKPWLQEIPEPVSQIVWDTWVEIHPETAKRLGVTENDLLELRTEASVIQAPAHLSTHVAQNVVALPFGQGHTAYGRYAVGRGANPWQLLPIGSRMVAVGARRTGEKRSLVTPLGLSTMLGRSIVEAISLDDLRRNVTPEEHGLKVPEPYEIRPIHVYPNHQWGMTIDLNACTGCGACVAACYAENNIPIVGKEEVARGHIMSWIRIERFVPEEADAPPLYLMPMLCQQCDNAPCEAVCPVYASYHTDEGLNGQVYNRCIGTRYCSNNCPYKVRRFNWFKHDRPEPLHLQLNPDVTVRGAGVMEKCTFCIQRIRATEMDAKAEGRPVRDGEITPACAQACPAQAITFGDKKDLDSAMMRRRAEHPLRAYRALEELNTQPAIVYLRELYRRREET